MRVLHLVHGIAVGALLGELEVEVEMRVRAALDHEVAEDVAADLAEHLVHRHERRLARGHLHQLAAAAQVHPLVHDQLDRGAASQPSASIVAFTYGNWAMWSGPSTSITRSKPRESVSRW